MRLDIYLKNQNNLSRNKSEELVLSGRVAVNNLIILKPAYNVLETDSIVILNDVFYVSRSAEKLKFFLNSLQIDLNNAICIDAGSSTGGFTQVLLEHNVKKVFAVDVGSSQLHESLSSDTRVVSVENCDIRNFMTNDSIKLLVCDLSFISISNVLESICSLTNQYLIILFKPQFEVGKDIKRDGNGVVKDVQAIENAMKKFEAAAFSMKLSLISKKKSQIKGKSGNEEFFYFFEK